ncbi:MAG: DNA-processing protein DprA [Gemmataceae bacterium]|nr:DNA-processing protein DprA [Gemmataceae bacterium]
MSSPLSPEVHDLLALHLVPGIGPRLTVALLERFGSAGAVLRAPVQALRGVPHIGDKLSESIHQAMSRVDVEAELKRMAAHGVRLLAPGAQDYPPTLVNIPDAPHLLYLRGTLETRDANAVGIVGSRHCTAYGRRVAERLAAELVRAGCTVISGLARGIDGCAHRGALQAGGRTLAVLAGGLSKIYPPEHKELADQVSASGGLISEAAMTMEPMAGMFPARNRIISGMSRAVVIVEAAQKSGALITATHAAEQGRPVFAVPGPVDNVASAGTNELIRKGAVLVRGAEDILEELDGIRGKGSPAKPTSVPSGMDDTQRRIWEFLADQPRHLDEITQHLAMPVAPLTTALFTLEMQKAVRRLPGNRYERW